MKRCRPLFLLVLVVSLGAQDRSGARAPGRGRVILYAEADFRGASIVLYPGDRIADFARQAFDNGEPANDRISSVAIEGPLKLVLHADSRHRGDALELTDSVSNLADLPGPSRRGHWNDIASSATVESAPVRRRWPGGAGRGGIRGPRVELYSEANYRGSRLVLAPGDRVENLADVGFEDDAPANDRISSIRLHGGAAVVVHADGRFRGARVRFTEDVPNLALRSDGLGQGSWNDRISAALAVTAGGPDSVALVRRVYRDLLGREPDAEGLDRYVAALEEEGLSEAELRSAIRRGREYRERDAAAAVRRAYRDLLRREPDEGGLANYVRLMLDDGWSEARVREALRGSEEFRERQRGG